DEDRGDAAFAQAVAGKRVVLGYAFRFDGAPSGAADCGLQPLPLAVVSAGEPPGGALFHPVGAVCNVPAFTRAVSASGFLNVAPDSDGVLRRVPLIMESGGSLFPSLALAAFSVYQRQSPAQIRLSGRDAVGLRVGTETVPLEGPGF